MKDDPGGKISRESGWEGVQIAKALVHQVSHRGVHGVVDTRDDIPIQGLPDGSKCFKVLRDRDTERQADVVLHSAD